MEDMGRYRLEMLEEELVTLAAVFPGLRFRFCRVMGKRISHLAGDTGGPDFDELRLDAGGDVLLLVSGRWAEHELSLRKRVLELRTRLREGHGGISGGVE